MTETQIKDMVKWFERYTKNGGMHSQNFARLRASALIVWPCLEKSKKATLEAIAKRHSIGKDTANMHYERVASAVEDYAYLSRQATMPWGVTA